MTERGEACDGEAFVRAHAAVTAVPFVPEVRLWLASEATALWHATETWMAARDIAPPFWGFAWAGGQALARYVLDGGDDWKQGGEARPLGAAAAPTRVLDVGCGSGLVAIAAAMRGAGVHGLDLDPLAIAAARLNGALNGVALDLTCGDALAAPCDADVILVGDLCYEEKTAARLMVWLRERAAEGRMVLLGDPGRAYVPGTGVRELAHYDVSVPAALEGCEVKRARVLRVLPA